DAEPRLERGVARDVVAGRALGQPAADHHVLDLGGVDLGALHRVAEDMRGHGNAVGLVERSPPGLADARAAVGDDGDGLAHVCLHPKYGTPYGTMTPSSGGSA